MNYSEKKFVSEDDWSLHMWQLPMSNAYQLSSAYKMGQLRYVTARHGSMGIPRCLESEAYLDYCKQLDGDHACLSADNDNNYSSIIMPAIKNMKTDCDKWKCHFDWNEFTSKTNSLSSKSPVIQSDFKFSQTESLLEQFDLLATAIKQKPPDHVQQRQEADKSNSADCESDIIKGVCRPNHEREQSFLHVANDVKINNKNEQKDFTSMSCQNSDNNEITVTGAGEKNCDMKLITHDNILGASYNYKFGSNAHIQNHTNSVHFNESGHSLKHQVIAHVNKTNILHNDKEHEGSLHNSGMQYSNEDSYNKLSKSSSTDGQTGLNAYRNDNQLYNENNNIHNSDPHNKRKVYHWHQNNNQSRQNDFRTANHQLNLNQMKTGANGKKWNNGSTSEASENRVMQPQYGYGRSDRRYFGSRTACVSSKFVPPIRMAEDSRGGNCEKRINGEATEEEFSAYGDLLSDPRMKNIDGKMVELIMNEVLDDGPNVGWDDIAGLQDAKSTIQEAVVWPMLRPDIFTGLRGPPKGVLLFGPPGTGKTMIGKAIASQSGATFFSISASCLTSKWIGEGEKMVRTLFAVARVKSPSVVFIDEIDSLLSQRSDAEHESSRRIKTEFLVQLDGVGAATGQVLVVGATNRPQELDEAARRRLVKRLYVPLPDSTARHQLIDQLLRPHRHTLTGADMAWVAHRTEGYSGADVAAVCSEAAMGPVRSISPEQMRDITLEQVRPMSIADFRQSVVTVRPSVCQDDLLQYQEWDRRYGSTRAVPPLPDT